MSVITTDKIMGEINTALHNHAVANFAQVLADCESSRFSIAQGAHEDVAGVRLEMGSDFDAFLSEATAVMFELDLKPRIWEG